MTELTCFKAYDIRGKIDVDIDANIAKNIGSAVALHLKAQTVVIGFDARETSPLYAAAVADGVAATGTNVVKIGLAGTEEMYWAVTEFEACAGIEITASHNPINYNGMKIVKSSSQPLDFESDFKIIKELAESKKFPKSELKGSIVDRSSEARSRYIDRVLSFIEVDSLKPLKIVVDSGNGAAGPTFDEIAYNLSGKNGPIEFIRLNHHPDHTFPNGIPNPMLPENRYVTSRKVKEAKADFGIAFDGDFDRCFFFDENGEFIQGEYIVSLLASIFLSREKGARIVHDPRVIWSIQDIVSRAGGIAVQSKTGHAFMKMVMRENEAVYGGEMSAHHYFRDFAYCDSGMIPWILIAELLSNSGMSLGSLVKDLFSTFPSSGEKNFRVNDPNILMRKVLDKYSKEILHSDETDGVSLAFKNWRFNLRTSNTEPLLRLNVETRGDFKNLKKQVKLITELIESENG